MSRTENVPSPVLLVHAQATVQDLVQPTEFPLQHRPNQKTPCAIFLQLTKQQFRSNKSSLQVLLLNLAEGLLGIQKHSAGFSHWHGRLLYAHVTFIFRLQAKVLLWNSFSFKTVGVLWMFFHIPHRPILQYGFSVI